MWTISETPQRRLAGSARARWRSRARTNPFCSAKLAQFRRGLSVANCLSEASFRSEFWQPPGEAVQAWAARRAAVVGPPQFSNSFAYFIWLGKESDAGAGRSIRLLCKLQCIITPRPKRPHPRPPPLMRWRELKHSRCSTASPRLNWVPAFAGMTATVISCRFNAAQIKTANNPPPHYPCAFPRHMPENPHKYCVTTTLPCRSA